MAFLDSFKNPSGKRIAWLTGAACVACCALPLIGLALGSAALAGLSVYSERAALALVFLGLAVYALRRMVRKSSLPSCAVDGGCGCGPTKASS